MAEDEVGEIRIEADVASAIKNIDRATDSMARLNQATGHTDKSLQRAEKASVQASSAMRSYAQSIGMAQKEAARFRSNTNLKNFTVFGKPQDAALLQSMPRSFAAFESSSKKAARGSDLFTQSLHRQREATRLQVVQQTQATAKAQQMERAYDGLANTRYALFDVARALTLISAATLGISIAAIKTEADFENLLIQVKRTSGTAGAEFATLRESVIGLTTEIPASIEDVTKIATLAGQLGIAADSIDEFTESVIKFSSTTDVSAEEAAEKIGRVAQLAGVGAGHYDDLAASIYQVGITSVSTESDILAITEQIAVSARQAGFAAEETVALSSALASLGVAPERARGSIQRVFNIITNAVDNGSEELVTFSRLSGMTAQEFGRVWKDDAQSGFLAFLDGLGQAGEAGENMNNVLADVGISAVRDTDALKRLAQNTEVYAQAISEASTGWNDGSAFAEGYADVAETLNNRLERLGNTIQAIIEAGQDNGPLKAFVGLLQEIADSALKIAKTPLGSVLAGVTLALGVFVGLSALGGAGLATLAASLFAVITALRFLTKLQQENVGTMKLATNAVVEYVAATRGMTVAQVQASMSSRGLGGAMNLLASGSRTATVALKGLKYSLASTGVGLALIALGTAATFVWSKFDDGDEATAQLKSDLAGLGEAIKQDTKTWQETGTAIATYTKEVEDVPETVDSAAQATRVWVGAQEEAKSAAEGTTEAIQDQTIAFGENADEAIRNALANNEAIQKLAGSDFASQDLERVGFRWSEAILLGMEQGSEGIDQYEARVRDRLDSMFLAGELGPGEVNLIGDALNTVFQALDTIGGEIDDQMALAEALKFVGGSAEDVGDGFEEATGELESFVDAIFMAIDAQSGMQGATNALGRSLAENGSNFSTFTEGGRENLAALKQAFATAVVASEGDAEALGGYVEGIISGMESSGVAGVRNLQVVQQMLAEVARQAAASQASIAGTSTVYVPGRDPLKFNNPVKPANTALKTNQQLADQVAAGFRQATDAADKSSKASGGAGKAAQKAVRTLSDYVSDLQGVFKDSFEFRFGFQQSEDSSRKAFRNIVEAMDEAERKARDLRLSIQELHATLSTLSSDRTILQYQLKIAREYNDTLREQAILAELEKNASDMAGTRADLTDETKDLGKQEQFLQKSLTGNNEASEEHRDMILSLVKAYQDQIVAYANTGVSQQKLEQYSRILQSQFEQQARQLGYNVQEVAKYSEQFSGLANIIRTMPTNITLSANTDPAQRALDEFFAKNQNRTITTRMNTINNPGAEQDAAYTARIESLRKQIAAMPAKAEYGYLLRGLNQEIAQLQQLRGYDRGGYTGDGGVKDIAGAVHGKEFVFDAPSTKAIGPGNLYAMMEAAKRGGGMYLGGYAGVMPSAPQSSGVSTVALTPLTIQQIAHAVQPYLVVDGQVVGKATSRAYAQSNRRGAN